MKVAIALLSLVAGSALAQGVTDKISPEGKAPAGCGASFDGTFMVTVAKVEGTKKRSVEHLTNVKREACAGDGILVVTLSNGTIVDAQGRTGYIASNYQFQFDGPPQAGAIYTAGFSACSNGSIALGSSTTFWECASGDFFNLYDRNWAAQCSAVEMLAIPCGGADPPGASEKPDGQVVGTQVVTTTVVKPLSDGQPQVITTTVPVPICQITDGQVQAHTTPCASITSSAVPVTTSLVPVSQYSDGQVQVTPPSAVPTISSESESVAPVTTPETTPEETPEETSTIEASTVAPTETAPEESSTLATSVGSSPSETAPAATTSAPPSSGASTVGMGSFVALVVGLIGAIAFL